MSDVAYQQCLRMKKIMHNYKLDLVKLFEHFEMNHDSKINLKEFTALVLDIDCYCEEDVIKELFKSIAGPDQML
jgi:Ca2+-binding EF-hand superfamily protein